MAPSVRPDMLEIQDDMKIFDKIKESKMKVPESFLSLKQAKDQYGLTPKVCKLKLV